ncbi:ZIP family metal transporter [Oscillibacter sp. MSJ-2]|uniref:ZIP family metal transporter n=1 Tax=Dysosmobacter acutus TaxID=2841504 RepID=A0ABS6F7K6_9FIRM|nr:ZIP family metal transporter [Dysosmobacter acutus]MBU5626252.1 ZIP family metal transporter [Dysosmobacter acutus]
MGVIGSILTITAIAGVGGTGLGGAAATLFRRDSDRTVSLLMSFAAGVMTSVVCFDLLTDALGPVNNAGISNVLAVVLGVLTGYGVIGLLNGWIEGTGATRRRIMLVNLRRTSKEARSSDRELSRRQLFVAGVVMAAAIALHNMPEGMVIGASFARSGEAAFRGGILMAIVIGLHNIPEGVAVAVPLIAGGMSAARAVGITALSGFPTVLGALLGFHLGSMGPMALTLSLSFASGAMLYVVFGELLPEATEMWRSKAPAFAATAGMMVGLIIVYA